ncbi:hypothetical protein GJ496_003488 [Pomphorhynchus laevis]|nr:hypothetical protein GJ496_003488 [Pomphorhynchus laevis]
MDCDEPYTCREILNKHLGRNTMANPTHRRQVAPSHPKWLPQAEMLPSPNALSDNLQTSSVALWILSDDTMDATKYLLDVTWMIKRWEHLPVVQHAVCDGDDEGLSSD